MDKKIIALVIVVVGTALVIGGWWLTRSDDVSNESVQTTEQQAENVTEPGHVTTFTTEEIAAHSTRTDCWTHIDGSVYDITPYVPVHPGRDEILRACGADGTSLFTSRTTDEGETVGSGTPHSSNASSQLSQFLIGELFIP